MKTVTLPGLKVIESWDENPDKNKNEYLKPEKARYVALTKYFNGTEFVCFFTEGKKHSWILKLWAYLNGVNKESK